MFQFLCGKAMAAVKVAVVAIATLALCEAVHAQYYSPSQGTQRTPGDYSFERQMMEIENLRQRDEIWRQQAEIDKLRREQDEVRRQREYGGDCLNPFSLAGLGC